MTLLVKLPWPARVLSPNARAHWSVVAKARKKAHADAYALALAVGARNWVRCNPRALLGDRKLYLSIDFYPPDRRRRDADNLLASMKAAFDGISAALGIDDSLFVLHPFLRDEVRCGGQVLVKVTGGPQG
jgi:Holliday junction resolvase RusA-like endonuclease